MHSYLCRKRGGVEERHRQGPSTRSRGEAQAWLIGDSMNDSRNEILLGFREFRRQAMLKVLARLSRLIMLLRDLTPKRFELSAVLDAAFGRER